MILENKDITIYLAQQKLAEWGDIIINSPVKKTRVYQNKAERLRYYLKAVQYELFLEDSELISILACIEKLAEITEWPTVPLLAEKEPVNIILGNEGPPGQDGQDGADGADAYIDLVSISDEILVTSSTIGGIKTYNLEFIEYIAPGLVLNIDTTAFPNVNSFIQESGRTVSSIPTTVTVTKQALDITSSIFTGPGSMTADFAAILNLTNINNGTPQTIALIGPGITTTQTLSVNADDNRVATNKTQAIIFVVPFLVGSSSTLLTQATAYASLTPLIEIKENKVITYNASNAYFEFIYPAAYGPLNIIKDGNGFNATAAFIQTIENIDMISGVESMYRYRTIITDISNQDYTFEF